MLFALAALAFAAPADDLVAFEALIRALHPAPFRYSSEEALTAAFAEERSRLSSPTTELEVGRAFSRVGALLGDAHVAVALPMMQPGSTTAVSLLPLYVREVEGKALVEASPLDLPSGTEVLSLDGRPWAEVEATLAGLVAADGLDPVAIHRHLEHDLPRYHALQDGMKASWLAEFRLPDGTVVSKTLDGTDREGLRALRASRRAAAWGGTPTPDQLPALDRRDGVALLRVPTFGVLDTAAFKAQVDALFAGIDPQEPLVIDLRGNEGGLRPNSFAILDHLLAEPYAEWTGMRVARPKIPNKLRKGLQFPFGSDRERLVPAFRRDETGAWRVSGDPLPSHPVAEPHQGPVTLLVDGRTGSAANGFVLVAKARRPDVVIVGEGLGGACDRHIGELPVVWTGPETGVIVMFSLIDIDHVAVAGCVPGRGLAPDVRVAPTVGEFVEGVDPWWGAAGR